MEHSTISIEQAQRIIAASQFENVPCFPRPVSHSNDFIKPLLESGADGLLIQMVNNMQELEKIVSDVKFSPVGSRSFGINRAHGYGVNFDEYVNNWNSTSSLIVQIESVEGVANIHSIVSHPEVDGVMIGPYDLSGSLGVPGQIEHPDVLASTRIVIDACEMAGKSCGTQVSVATNASVSNLLSQGYTYVILGSDLFTLSSWSTDMSALIKNLRTI